MGYRRIAAQLARQGTVAGADLVRRLMRELGLAACQPRPWRPVTTKQVQAGPIPDLVNRDFSAAGGRPTATGADRRRACAQSSG
jgi:transposase InsO family protein